MKIDRRRWLRAVHALTMLAAVAVATAALVAVPRTRADVVQGQAASGDGLLRELAERLLSTTPGLGPFSSSTPSTVQLLPGALPSDLPFTPPLPPNSTLIGSAERPSYPRSLNGPLQSLSPTPAAPTGVHVDIVLDVADTPADILSFYQTTMAGLGWSPPPRGFRPPNIGFEPSFGPGANNMSATFCQSQRGPLLMVSVLPAPSGPQDVRVSLDTGNAGSCNPPTAPPFLPPGLDILPALAAPPGVTVQTFGGGGGGNGYASSQAMAATATSSADLEAFYAQELAAAGWTRLDGGTAGPMTWSTWSLPAQDNASDWQGFLSVRDAPGQDLHALHLDALSPSLLTSGGGSGMVVTGNFVNLTPLVGTVTTPSTGIDIGTPAVPLPTPTPAPPQP